MIDLGDTETKETAGETCQTRNRLGTDEWIIVEKSTSLEKFHTQGPPQPLYKFSWKSSQ